MKEKIEYLTKIFIFYLFIFILMKNNNNNYIFKIKKKIINKRIIRDVLFINGCDPNFLPHPYRYRVLHQIEQLNAGNLLSSDEYYLNIDPLIVRDFRFIIFYRCPWTKQVGEAITLAKNLNKKVFFDIDDLVINTKYTNLIPYVQTLSKNEKLVYDDGVKRMGKTLKLCEGAITTTEILAQELINYVPEVFINRNVASEEMFKLSKFALEEKKKQKNSDEIIIGYFSGSITHNSDIELIIPALIKILKEFKNIKLLFLGELDLPHDLKKFSSKIIKKPFVDWSKLPQLIANVDINIAPITNNIFNAAKSENKWVEAALVKVPTVASNYGAFKKVINNGKTGLLCNTTEDWYNQLKTLILDRNLRKTIAENAFDVCKEKYNSIVTGRKLSNYINSVINKHIGFILPSTQISGGIRIVLEHSSYLQDLGWDVDLLAPEANTNFILFKGHKFNLIGLNNSTVESQYDILVATLYSTLYTVLNYSKVKKKLYLVQNYETDFYLYGDCLRTEAEKTYSMPFGVEYITISKWCKNWLKEKYQQNSSFAPNCIDLNDFIEHKRNLNKKIIRILIEGDNSSHYKNVDESFKIIEKLEKSKYEIWYMSYNSPPKSWYRVDKFLHKIPYENVSQVYQQCDILIKSSWLESFSYPPLEMMATGGYSIVVPNGGNVEYLKNEENCLFYKLGDLDAAVKCIERLISDENLQNHLYENGLITAKKRDKKNCKEAILSLYEK
jgi:glycosyltransferase involved in cell wall biosynthesis